MLYSNLNKNLTKKFKLLKINVYVSACVLDNRAHVGLNAFKTINWLPMQNRYEQCVYLPNECKLQENPNKFKHKIKDTFFADIQHTNDDIYIYAPDHHMFMLFWHLLHCISRTLGQNKGFQSN